MKYITILLFFVACSVQAQKTYDVVAKDGKPVLVENDGKQVREVPTSSQDLAKQHGEADARLKALVSRRAQVAELLRLDEEILLLAEQMDFLSDLFNKTKAVEKSIAEASKVEPPKQEPSETTAKQ